MPLHFWGDLVTMVGDIVIALTVIAVIEKLRTEKKIDAEVIDIMKIEKWAGIAGIALVILGQVLKLMSDIYA